MIFLYTRVSSDKQSTDTQEFDLLRRYPDAEIHRETASGVKQRPVLEALIAKLQRGDTIAVAAMDRLGRRTSEILVLIEDLQKRGVNIVALREGLDYSTPAGRLTAQILVAISEMERSLISARTKAALYALKAKGVHVGRPRSHSNEAVELAKNMRAQNKSYAEIKDATGISITRLSELLGKRAQVTQAECIEA